MPPAMVLPLITSRGHTTGLRAIILPPPRKPAGTIVSPYFTMGRALSEAFSLLL